MRTETIEIFKFDELNDRAKEKAREWWRTNCDFAWQSESKDSIIKFCEHFGVELKDWCVAPWEPPWFKTNAENSHFRGRKLKHFDREFMPTGYCLDCDLWMTFFDEFKRTGDAKEAFDTALYAGFLAWGDDMEYQLSDEYVDEMLIDNEYEFYEDGSRI